jgi:peptidoglycan/LPS O-acetylase OafA/YrhL
MAGFLSLDLYDEWREGPRRVSLAWDGLTLGAWVLVVLQPYPHVDLPISVAACMLSLVAAFRGPVLSRCVRSPPIVGIGGMCYTIYLYHSVVRKPLDLVLSSTAPSGISWLDALIRLCVVVPYTVAICTVLFLLLERPFMVRDWHTGWGALLGAPRTWLPRADAFLRA